MTRHFARAPPGSSPAREAIFAVGRDAGRLAHALAEYGRGGPCRPRSSRAPL
ncbi:hypothetical protein [Actinomadura sediminis]|uniref:Uncharacterized protein n=1 Tax=Actinomadura sediminis TaxID=1038904 RepID=A0ABW3EYJ2_9ACTN